MNSRNHIPEHGRVGFSWLIFAGLGVLMLIYAIYSFQLPHTEPSHWDWFIKPGNFRYYSTHWHGIGFLALGVGVFTVSVASTGFRRGERWAWYAFWYWPAYFLFHTLSTWPGVFFLPLLLASVTGLLLPLRAFFPKREEVAERDAA